MKLAFAGTPEFAATVLRGLAASRHKVGLVVSQPDRPRGRRRKPAETPVARLARAEGLPLAQPAHIGEIAEEIAAHDVLVVAAYGQILRPDTLYATRKGAYNVHASLLPRYRGAAPVERAIMAGERETGISIIKMDEGLDTGPVALRRRTSIPPEMTGGELMETLANLGAKAMAEVIDMLEERSLTLGEQDSSHATYASKLEDEEKVIRWGEGVERVHNLVRALAPHVGARTFHHNFAGPVKILRSRVFRENLNNPYPGKILPAKERILVACGIGVLEVEKLQAPGRKALSAADFLRGRPLRGVFLS